jgi:hypothetical protein
MRSPLLLKATMDGVVRAPSEFSRTTGSPPSMNAMQELVVPKSIPKILDIIFGLKGWLKRKKNSFNPGAGSVPTWKGSF